MGFVDERRKVVITLEEEDAGNSRLWTEVSSVSRKMQMKN